MKRPDRKKAERAGRRGEALAAIWLMFKGYRILARRLRTPVGEIDILASRGKVLAVVEVKSRAKSRDAAEAIGPRQWDRLARAAQWALAHRPEWAGRDLRFDAILLSPDSLPNHVTDAWRPHATCLS